MVPWGSKSVESEKNILFPQITYTFKSIPKSKNSYLFWRRRELNAQDIHDFRQIRPISAPRPPIAADLQIPTQVCGSIHH